MITAGDGITGDIIAAGDGAFDPAVPATWATIGRVVVGGAAEPMGIRGDIKAEAGEIVSILTEGPIGTETIQPRIVSANKLIEVRAVSELNPASVLPLQFNVDIRAGLDFVPTGFTNADGCIRLIETDGGISGEIRAANLGYDAGGGGGSGGGGLAPNGFLSGIIAKGPITADIDIDYNMEYSNIIGSSITGTVKIGMLAKGTIVATAYDTEDEDAGTINTVWVGYAIDPPAVYVDRFPRGLAGVSCDPINATSPAVWYARQCAEGGTHDSVIYAPVSIWEVRLHSMTQTASYLPESEPKHEVPRVESPRIQTLEVSDMRAGVVWSGKMEFWPEPPDPENDYAAIHNITLGCVGPCAAVWFRDCPRAEVLHDLLGALHVPALQDGETIWIGDRIGDGPAVGQTNGDICQCEVYSIECEYTDGLFEEDSPRAPVYQDRGIIVIRQAQGLKGQIVINGNNTELAAETGWKGTVVVGAEDSESEDYIVLGPDEVSPYEAPYYELPSGPLGGGAVGLAPFAFYPTDCVPPHNDPDPLVGIITTAFETGYPVLVRWYGPVTLPQDPPPPSTMSLLKVRVAWPFDECVPTPAVDLTSIFAAALHADGRARTLGIGANVQPRGVEHILLWNPESEWGQLVCDEIVGKPEVTFAVMYCTGSEYVPDRYIFRVHEDCNANDVPDPVEIDNDPDLDRDRDGYLDDCDPTNCECDWNANERIDVADIFLFLNDWFADDCAAKCFGVGPSPCPTPESSCGVPALFAFLTCWFNSFSDPLCNP